MSNPNHAEVFADNPNYTWHALRGYDFAALDTILREGIRPTDNIPLSSGHLRHNPAVSLSISPSVARSDQKPSDSFFAYSLQESISLAVHYDRPRHSEGEYGGFNDETRVPDIYRNGKPVVMPEQIHAVMIPAHAAKVAIGGLKVIHEPRKPQRHEEYVKRTLMHLEELGILQDEIAHDLEADISKERAAALGSAFLQTYCLVMERLGFEDPTLEDMIVFTMQKRNKNLQLVTWDSQFKQKVSESNGKLAGRTSPNRSRSGVEAHEHEPLMSLNNLPPIDDINNKIAPYPGHFKTY